MTDPVNQLKQMADSMTSSMAGVAKTVQRASDALGDFAQSVAALHDQCPFQAGDRVRMGPDVARVIVTLVQEVTAGYWQVRLPSGRIREVHWLWLDEMSAVDRLGDLVDG